MWGQAALTDLLRLWSMSWSVVTRNTRERLTFSAAHRRRPSHHRMQYALRPSKRSSYTSPSGCMRCGGAFLSLRCVRHGAAVSVCGLQLAAGSAKGAPGAQQPHEPLRLLRRQHRRTAVRPHRHGGTQTTTNTPCAPLRSPCASPHHRSCPLSIRSLLLPHGSCSQTWCRRRQRTSASFARASIGTCTGHTATALALRFVFNSLPRLSPYRHSARTTSPSGTRALPSTASSKTSCHTAHTAPLHTADCHSALSSTHS